MADLEDSAPNLRKATEEANKAIGKKVMFDDIASIPSPKRPPVPKWKYHFVSYEGLSEEQIKERVKKLGEDGWELAVVVNLTWIFKRPDYS